MQIVQELAEVEDAVPALTPARDAHRALLLLETVTNVSLACTFSVGSIQVAEFVQQRLLRRQRRLPRPQVP